MLIIPAQLSQRWEEQAVFERHIIPLIFIFLAHLNICPQFLTTSVLHILASNLCSLASAHQFQLFQLLGHKNAVFLVTGESQFCVLSPQTPGMKCF